ncbi:MAG: gephyrin-like molybdotransferase Glp [Halolamina sp.]
MTDDNRHEVGFTDRTRVAEARAALLEAVAPHDRTETVPIGAADGRVLAASVTAPNPVPSYDRAAMDGYAVRAPDTFGASDRSPEALTVTDRDGPVGPNEAARVHTGSDLPAGADAVVMIEETEGVGEGPDGDPREVEVFDAVTEGENVGDAGEDVAAGQHLFDAGHRLRPSDLGLLKSVGLAEVTVREPPTVAVIPTGEELVQSDPGPGEVIETNGLTVSRLVERWGGTATYRDVVDDDEAALRAAVAGDADHDLVVTTGGSSVGERDLVPDVVADLGEVLVHGVALKPGHPVALGVAHNGDAGGDGATPVLMLPGYPVACIVNAVQFLRPALKAAGDLPTPARPTTEATLDRKVPSSPGERTFARVRLENGDGDSADGRDGGREVDADRPRAVPTRASGSGVLSSVALADGWVVVPESVEGFDAGETVSVQHWEQQP